MFKKASLSLAVFCTAAAWAGAEPQRAFLTTENKFPERGALELGYEFIGREFDTLKYNRQSVFARYGLIENLTARIHAPYDTLKPDFGGDESGLGDVTLGADLVAYQDVFSFPFVIPHLDVSLPTGDEDKGLGSGDALISAGVAVGTKTQDRFVWVLDVSYASVYDAKASEKDDVFGAALSWIWELSDRFTVNIEGLFRHAEAYDSNAILVGGGMNYSWSPKLNTGVFIGRWDDDDSGEEQLLNIRAAYAF
jgi:hypothetical protein